MRTVLYIAVVCFLMMSCKKEATNLPPDFNHEITPVPITENVNVGAYYYNYSAADWAKKYSNTPVAGEYSALDPAVMAQHRQWADEGGVDFFIFNWNGAATGDPLLKSFITGRNNQVKMVINFNMAHLSATNNSPLTGAKLNTFLNEFKTLATAHFNQAYYYKIDGRPVILISPLNLSANAAASIDYAAVLPVLKEAMSKEGIDLYVIGEITSGWLPPIRYAPAIKAMDAVGLSNWSTDVYDRSVFFNAFSDINWKNWKDSTTNWNVDYVPCIFPGFNDKTMSPASKLYNIGGNAAFYETYCNVAKHNMGSKRIVLINSWNNFQAGTSLEPAKEYGTTYLGVTKAQFKVKVL
ncbi:glycoside hydrolase family 99-like domain-containing protein [Chitinophaga defluvii]|uniref:Glycoside hydrolase family 99-like domain-containing protein n=1 Tax=Chitinophaga defluvii TaxID=3163343 RepID=A0ABV2TBI3_9BACT